jgi:hypothetical protein
MRHALVGIARKGLRPADVRVPDNVGLSSQQELIE